MASSLELNKLFAGVLTAGIIAVGAGVFSGILYRPHHLEQHAFSIALPEGAVGDNGATLDDTPPLAVLLASADPGAGEALTRQCTACHVFAEGGDNRVGPVLWDVVGRDVASVAGFNYSAAMQGVEGTWTFEALDRYLTAPRDTVPGTSMSFAGLRNAGDRANLLAFLRTLSADPAPLPEVEEVEQDDTAAAEDAGEATETVADAAEEAAETMADAADEATETVADAADEATETVAEAAEEATETVADAADEAAGAAGEVVEEAAETVADAAEAVADVAEEAAETVAEAAEAATEAVEAAGETVVAAVTGAAASATAALVSDANPADGERAFRQCAACHTVDQGGQNRVGPNLWDVFGADVGHHEGFSYSPALLAIDGVWTADKLDGYLANPREFAPGNRMAFAGVRAPEQRAALIAYLRSLSDDPKPVDIQ